MRRRGWRATDFFGPRRLGRASVVLTRGDHCTHAYPSAFPPMVLWSVHSLCRCLACGNRRMSESAATSASPMKLGICSLAIEVRISLLRTSAKRDGCMSDVTGPRMLAALHDEMELGLTTIGRNQLGADTNKLDSFLNNDSKLFAPDMRMRESVSRLTLRKGDIATTSPYWTSCVFFLFTQLNTLLHLFHLFLHLIFATLCRDISVLQTVLQATGPSSWYHHLPFPDAGRGSKAYS